MYSSHRSCGSATRSASRVGIDALAASTALAADGRLHPLKSPPMTSRNLRHRRDRESAKCRCERASASPFGFSKPLLETPRTVSLVSEEQLTAHGHLHGGRSHQGRARRVLRRRATACRAAARRALRAGGHVLPRHEAPQHAGPRAHRAGRHGLHRSGEGSASSIFGLGKIGGYTNISPKSGRAPNSAATCRACRHSRRACSAGTTKPKARSASAALFEIGSSAAATTCTASTRTRTRTSSRSAPSRNTFRPPAARQLHRTVPRGSRHSAQHSITSGAYLNRVTQDLIDNGRYISGSPLVNLDLNGDGRVGYVESYTASPVRGNISGNNGAHAAFAWPTDASGNPLPPRGRSRRSTASRRRCSRI